MSAQVRLIVHPYSARKDLGFGHDRYAFELLQNLPGLGVSVDIAQFGHPKGMVSAFLAEARAVGSLAFDRSKVLYHATATLNAQCAITARKHPLVTTIHDVLWFFVTSKYDSKIKYRLKTYAIKRATKHSDGVIVPFSSTKDFLTGELGTPKDRVHVVPYGIDRTQFRPRAPGERLERPAFLPKGPVVLFVGSLTYGKGIDALIRCFDAVVGRVPDAHLVIGSAGWDQNAIRSMAEQSRAKDHIHFVGFIPEDQLRAAYVHSTVTVFPSRYGFGLATLESMTCGTPTISGRTLDAPEFVGDAGLLADPENEEELSHQIVTVLTDGTLREELSRRGIERTKSYSWQQTAARTAEVYRLLTNPR